MAAEDYVVADRPQAGLTAGEKISEVGYDNPDTDPATETLRGDRRYAAFANYDAALDALAAREDIEGLSSRRIREAASDFATADYMRGEASDTAPTPGSVNGVAPDEV